MPILSRLATSVAIVGCVLAAPVTSAADPEGDGFAFTDWSELIGEGFCELFDADGNVIYEGDCFDSTFEAGPSILRADTSSGGVGWADASGSLRMEILSFDSGIYEISIYREQFGSWLADRDQTGSVSIFTSFEGVELSIPKDVFLFDRQEDKDLGPTAIDQLVPNIGDVLPQGVHLLEVIEAAVTTVSDAEPRYAAKGTTIYTFYAVRRPDIDEDEDVDFDDLLRLLGNWGSCEDTVCPADFDYSGSVDTDDLMTLLAAWTI